MAFCRKNACFKQLVILLQPAGEHLTILLVSIDKAGMAGVPEQMPLALRDILVERGIVGEEDDAVGEADLGLCPLGCHPVVSGDGTSQILNLLHDGRHALPVLE